MTPTNRYLCLLCIGFVAGLLLVAVPVMSINYVLDPYQFYRLRSGPQGPFRNDARYQNAALLRHLDYDTVLVGTSLSENFTPGMFAPAWKVLKLTAAGSSAHTQALMANVALAQGRARRLVLELSVFAYEKGPFWVNQKHAFPDHLYPARLTTPFQYLLSTDLLRLSLGLDAGAALRPLDELYTWQVRHVGEFGHANWLRRARLNCDRDLAAMTPAHDSQLDAAINAQLVVLLEQHPDVEFVGFLPPLPLVSMYIQNDTRVRQRLQFRARMRALADHHPNLRVHDFALLLPLVNDPRRYKDLAHYEQVGNREMAAHMVAGSYLTGTPGDGEPLTVAVASQLPPAACRQVAGAPAT